MITFVSVFTVIPEKQPDALRAIQKVYNEVAIHHPGFISAQLLPSDDGNRVTAIAHWESEEDLKAMRNTPEFTELHDRNFLPTIVGNDGHLYSHSVAIKRVL